VTDNVALVQRLAGGAERPGTAELLAELGLSTRATAYPGALSGGELARAGLAVAMANGPAVLLADEPTGDLDGDTEAEVLAMLVATARAGVAILVASHSPAVAAAADRVLTLADGVLV
jgi:putative ABC transport system ATP-binding protein